MIAETYLQLVKDPAHWAFELTVEAATFVVGFAYGRGWLKRHDKKKHGRDE